MNQSFSGLFNGRSVFVTGHTGFKGSWLCLWLHHLGAKVTGYALAPPTDPNNFTLSGIKNLLEKHHEADVRDEKAMHNALLEAEPDIVLHLAAQSIVRESYTIPRETFDINVMGIASLLDGIRKLEKPCVVVVITSDKCYENLEQIWGYRESDPLGDLSPYGGRCPQNLCDLPEAVALSESIDPCPVERRGFMDSAWRFQFRGGI